jgi:galactokinase
MPTLRLVEDRAAQAYGERFGAPAEVIASAPGRVNLIGEHTDYAGGWVLPCAIDRRVAVAAGRGTGVVYSVDFAESRPSDGARDHSWADYPQGVGRMLAADPDTAPLPAWRAAIAGDVPQAAGLSSSAAVECATAVALDALFALRLTRQRLAILCRRVENEFLGLQTGIMDQYASLLCQPQHALLIDCRTLDAQAVPMDLDAAGLALVVCDTQVARGLRDSDYNARRETCERAAWTLGVAELRDARPEDLGRLAGDELRCARHVVGENGRVLRAAAALSAGDYAMLGQLMYASHASLRDDYAVSTPELDAFVEVARACGTLGARLTGAGFGGCAIALIAVGEVEPLASATRREYAQRGYRPPEFYQFHPSGGR